MQNNTAQPTQNKKRLITLINIAKGQLCLDNELYRSMLNAATGKDSLRAMSLSELEQALECFKQKGFKPRSTSRQTGVKGKRLSPKSGSAKVAMIDKIRAVWITMGHHNVIQDASETALDAYVRRITKSQQLIDSTAWLNEQQAYRVLESLKNWHRRELLERIALRTASNSTKSNDQTLGYNQVVDLYLNAAYGGATHE
ncbi:gp16 family protein [Shewanella psychrotolerans]|uniref:gp16 family protein n=1 Tax=Shewanella psychrotolerans TaxID=2864206 RepID=UPI001C662294|nr:regulatory protein GemA [Shewanella psychrotolerans]QYK02776.1 regulatory protein GemA [Shewanella psychrotolerans]